MLSERSPIGIELVDRNYPGLCILQRRTAMFVVILFLAVFVTVDLVTTTKNSYNLVSLGGLLIYVVLLFVFSHSPSQVRPNILNTNLVRL